jgi:inhibitor of KinA
LGKNLTYKPFGHKAILIEWEPRIDENILNDILQFKEKISFENREQYADFIIAYNSLTIVYHLTISDFKKEQQRLEFIYNLEFESKQTAHFIWEIPVCYNVKFGIDLKEISVESNLTIEEIIKVHSEKIYTVFFIGFIPGFLYLGGLDKKLFFDRKENPRLQVPKGAVGIGGKQTGIYPFNSAGGWNIIGNTPINFFEAKKTNPCFAQAGDRIKFLPISIEEYHQIEKKIKENSFQISKTLLHD